MLLGPPAAELPTTQSYPEDPEYQLQVARAARLLALVAYVPAPGFFLACKTCQIAVPLSLIPFHFSSTKVHTYNRKDCAALLAAWEALYLDSHLIRFRTEADAVAWGQAYIRYRPQPPKPLPGLAVHRALQCKFISQSTGHRCQYIVKHPIQIRAHCYNTHHWGTEPKQGHEIRLAEGETLPWERDVPCQRLRNSGKAATLWRVSPASAEQPAGQEPPAGPSSSTGRTWADLEAQLTQKSRARQAHNDLAAATSARYPIHISPWIEKTGWAAYLRGYNLSQVAQLLQSPRPHEVGLLALHNAFDALIESARSLALEQDEINVFTLHRVNSFIPGRAFKRPLLTKLVDGTYRKYKATWRKLLSYVYRLTITGCKPDLPYLLTPQQQQAIAALPVTITAALPPRRPAPATTAASAYPPRRHRDPRQGPVDSSPGPERSSPPLSLSPVRLRFHRHPRPAAGRQLSPLGDDSSLECNAPPSPQQALSSPPPPTPPQLSTL